MKLIKKLLPAMTVASVGLCVSPIIASCSLNAKKSTKWLDLKSDYKRILEPRAEKNVENAADGEKLYFEEANKNPGIIIDDLAIMWTSYFKGLGDAVETAKVRFSNVECFKEETKYEVSMKLELELKYQITAAETVTKYDLKATLNFQNVPYELTSYWTSNEYANEWYLKMEKYSEPKPFSLWNENSKIYGTLEGSKTVGETSTGFTGDEKTIAKDYSTSGTSKDTNEIYQMVCQLMAVPSDYFQNVKRQS